MSRTQLLVGTTLALLAVGVFSFEFYKLGKSQNQQDAQVINKQKENHTHSNNDDEKGGIVSRYSSVQALQEPDDLNIDMARIGWYLFKDPNLSSSGQVSCESCHNLSTNGADNLPVSVGVNGVGSRNSPTIFNVSNNYRFFWDGRVDTLAEQLEGPIHNPVEMDSSWEQIINYVSASTHYKNLFADVRTMIDKKSITNALVEFQNALITLNSPFDKYLKGDDSAMEPIAKEGWKLFQSQGCVACHRGANIGGGMLMKFGVFGNETTGEERLPDSGRFESTNREADKFIFRVASLRNAADTPPYFHDGQTSTLSEAVAIMGKSQLGVDLSEAEIDALVAFIGSLSGEKPKLLERFENEEG